MMKWTEGHHLAYCTNIHPAESWVDTRTMLERDVLAVRDRLKAEGVVQEDFAIGLRLSALAARELLEGDSLQKFKEWLQNERCYVFTINGFPYGDFHNTSVKEEVYRPDWTTIERLDYTKNLFRIVAELAPLDSGGSVSTLPGSFKEFEADEAIIFAHLEECAGFIEELSQRTGKDLHLGLEPEPLGHFENTFETVEFFKKFFETVSDPDMVKRRIGVNFDCCHFAIEFDDCTSSLAYLLDAGIRISKIHLSSALEFDPRDEEACEALKNFEEPTYLHQVVERRMDEETGDEFITRYKDLPDYWKNRDKNVMAEEARCHFHVPLYAEAASPLGTTQESVREVLEWREEFPDACQHYEIETYTWGVLPTELQQDLTSQIVAEWKWVMTRQE